MSNKNYIERYWRDATPADAIAEPPMVARFKNDVDYDWFIDSLTGIRCNHDYPWYSTKLGSHKHCQVYDAPDPGEGWRLIDPEKEHPEEHDECLCPISNAWFFCNERLRRFGYSEDFIIRRRIEQPKPEPKYEPFRWEDREQLRGRIVTYVQGDRTVEFRCELFATDDGGFSVHHIYSDWLCKNAVFVDTKEPVGRRVE